jgi:hypothetical protein
MLVEQHVPIVLYGVDWGRGASLKWLNLTGHS